LAFTAFASTGAATGAATGTATTASSAFLVTRFTGVFAGVAAELIILGAGTEVEGILRRDSFFYKPNESLFSEIHPFRKPGKMYRVKCVRFYFEV
jgi:hypothetical protein